MLRRTVGIPELDSPSPGICMLCVELYQRSDVMESYGKDRSAILRCGVCDKIMRLDLSGEVLSSDSASST